MKNDLCINVLILVFFFLNLFPLGIRNVIFSKDHRNKDSTMADKHILFTIIESNKYYSNLSYIFQMHLFIIYYIKKMGSGALSGKMLDIELLKIG